jgi:hypothetical protein
MRSTAARRLVLGVLFFVLCLALAAPAAWAVDDPDVTVSIGATPIVNGSCVGSDDITVENGIFAVSFARESTPPWGVPKGSILDGAVYDANGVLNDRITLIDYLPNGWAAWPNTYQKVTVPVESADMVVVQVERDYMELELVTTFTIEKGSNFLQIRTVATNPLGSGETYTGIDSGYTFCTTGGFMFGPFNRDAYSVTDDYGKYVLGYDKDYSIGLHFADADTYAGGTGWKDLYQKSTLAPGDEMTFDAVVQFEGSASISRFVKAVADYRADTTGVVGGEVTPAADDFPEPPVVVVEKDGETFTWVVAEGGFYSLDLPAGDYKFYALAKDFSPTAKVDVTVEGDDDQTLDFAGLAAMSQLTVRVKKEGKVLIPIDARIRVTGGIAPVVGFLGKSVFFTDLDTVGTAKFKVAAGDIKLNVTSGDKFTSKIAVRDVTIEEGKDKVVQVTIKTVFSPRNIRWFSADLHHHSNILDGVTPPRDLVQSQLAAKLDFTLVSDHDSVANNATVKKLSSSRSMPFISANEVSPIWAHFVTFPVSLKTPVLVDPAGTAKQIIDSAHAAGMTIALAHPYIAYGYFTANDAGTIPGGYYDQFDLIELQSTRVTAKGTSPDERTLAKVYELWTGAVNGKNKKYYLTGGYDVHDVWAHMSGGTRTFVKIPLDLNVNQKNYIAGLKAGRAFVTTGPLVTPHYFQFGTTIKVKNSSPRVNFTLTGKAVYGLKSIQVVREGKVIRTLTFGDETTAEKVTFSIKNLKKSWYSFIVEDVNGDRALTNPVWTRMVD